MNYEFCENLNILFSIVRNCVRHKESIIIISASIHFVFWKENLFSTCHLCSKCLEILQLRNLLKFFANQLEIYWSWNTCWKFWAICNGISQQLITACKWCKENMIQLVFLYAKLWSHSDISFEAMYILMMLHNKE